MELAMDLQTILLSIAITAVLAILIYLIYVCGMREQTYEEMMEEQRQQRTKQSEILSKKSEKKEKVKKKKKKQPAADVVVTTDEGDMHEEILEDEPEAELIAEPEPEPVIEQVQQAPPTKATKRRGKHVRSEEHQEIKKTEVIVEEISIVSQTEHVLTTSAPVPESRKEDNGEAMRALEAEQALEALILTEAKTARTEKKSKKSKSHSKESSPVGDSVPVTVSTSSSSGLLTDLKMAVLSQTEITSLIEILLNKQGNKEQSIEWSKKNQKGDPMLALKKTLEDKEKALADEQSQSAAATGKLKNLQVELNSEKQKYASLEKSTVDKAAAYNAEVSALHSRMQRTHESHAAELGVLRQQVSANKDNTTAARLQQLTEENLKLKNASNVQASAKASENSTVHNQQMKLLQEQLNIAYTKSASTESSKKAQEKRYTDQIKKLEASKLDAESVLSRKLSEMNEELHRSQSKNATISRDFESSKSSCQQMEQKLINQTNLVKTMEVQVTNVEQLQDVTAKLKSAESDRDQYSESVSSLKKQLSEVQSSNQDTDAKYQELVKENSMLSTELRSTKERTAAEGQEAPSATPDNEDNDWLDMLADNDEVKPVAAEVASEDLTKLQAELDAQKAKNNTLRERNWKAMDALSAAEKAAAEATALKEQVARLTEQLNNAKNQTPGTVGELQQLKDELAALKTENNGLLVGIETSSSSLTAQIKVCDEVKTDQLKKTAEIDRLQGELSAKDKQLQAVESDLQQSKLTVEKNLQSVQVVSATQPDSQTELSAANSSQSSSHTESHTASHSEQHTASHTASHVETHSHSASHSHTQGMTVLTRTRVQEHSSGLDLSQIMGDLSARDAELAILREVLSQKELQLQKLQDQATSAQHNGQNGHSSHEEIGQMKQDLAYEKSKNNELRMQLRTGGRVAHFMTHTSSHSSLQDQLDIKTSEIDKLRDIVKDYWNKNNMLTEKVEVLESENQHSELTHNKIAVNLRHQVNTLTKKEEDLHSRTKELKTKISELQETSKITRSSVTEHNGDACGDAASTSSDDLLKRLFPDVTIHKNMTAEQKLKHYESQLKNNQHEALDSPVEVNKLQAQIQHYKAVLTDTEGMLNMLQSSVGNEEARWQQKVKESESEAEKLRQEILSLKNSASQQSDSKNLQDRISQLEATLSSKTTEADRLKAQVKETQASVDNISVTSSNVEEELSTIRDQLDDERRSKRELTTSNVRLNALVKIGQDALHHEQELVKKLEVQLTQLCQTSPKSMSNGTNGTSPSNGTATSVKSNGSPV